MKERCRERRNDEREKKYELEEIYREKRERERERREIEKIEIRMMGESESERERGRKVFILHKGSE